MLYTVETFTKKPRILEPSNLAATHEKQRKEDLKASLEYRAGLYLQTIATTHSHTHKKQSVLALRHGLPTLTVLPPSTNSD